MPISREEAEKIGKEAAQRRLSIDCLTIAQDLDSVREDAIDSLHTLIYNYGVSLSKYGKDTIVGTSDKESLLKSLKNAQDAVQQTIIDTGYAAPEAAEDIKADLNRIIQLVEEEKLYEAIERVEILSNDVFLLMLRTTVACECSEIKSEEHHSPGEKIWYLGEWWEEEYTTAEVVIYHSSDGKKRLYVYWDGSREVKPAAPG